MRTRSLGRSPALPGDGHLRDPVPLLARREARAPADGDGHRQDLHRLPARLEAAARQRPEEQPHPVPDRPQQPQGSGLPRLRRIPADERVIIDKERVARGEHLVGKIFFANYQNLDEELEARSSTSTSTRTSSTSSSSTSAIAPASATGSASWSTSSRLPARPDGDTAGARPDGRALTEEELRRDTYVYFGRADGYTYYASSRRSRTATLCPTCSRSASATSTTTGTPAPTAAATRRQLRARHPPARPYHAHRRGFVADPGKYELRDEKTIVFCVDDTHAAFMAAEFRRLSGDPDYAARITRSERNSHQLERNFAEVGRAKPRVAVTVDLLTTGFDAPDVKNIVFARPLKSAILYKQMKGRGTRLCEDIDKRYFTIFDYVGAAQLEDAEFDGHPANIRSRKAGSQPRRRPASPRESRSVTGSRSSSATTERYVCLADGRKIPFDDTASSRRGHPRHRTSEPRSAPRSGSTRIRGATFARSSRTATSTSRPSVTSLSSTRPTTSTSSRRSALTWCAFRPAMTA